MCKMFREDRRLSSGTCREFERTERHYVVPSFLDQRHEQRTGFFMRLNLQRRQCILVGMAASCRFSPDDHNFSRPGCRRSPLRSRLNDSYHFHRGRFLDLFDC